MYLVIKAEDEKNQILFLRNQECGYAKISRKCKLSKECVRGMCRQRTIGKSKKRGRKAILIAAYKLRLKREICSMKANGAKINCKKLINACYIPVSRFTVARYKT